MSFWKPNDTIKMFFKAVLSCKNLCPLKGYALSEHLRENNRFTTFPNVFIALRIYIMMPITVASGERSFSKPKLIKTYLRSTVSQERLNSLSKLSIESEMAKAIDFKNILNDFANKKARKVFF